MVLSSTHIEVPKLDNKQKVSIRQTGLELQSFGISVGAYLTSPDFK